MSSHKQHASRPAGAPGLPHFTAATDVRDHAPEFETDRLRLRMFRPDDMAALARIFAKPDVMRYLGNGEPIGRSETERALTSIINHWTRFGFGRWAVVHKADNRLLGYGGLRSSDGLCELVYLLDQPYWGRGLATELARACLHYGFIGRGCDSIMAVAKPENLASRRVLEKSGFRFERESVYLQIKVVQYALTRGEYLASVGGDKR